MARSKWEDNIKFYDFYKSPDGEDCLEKTYYYTKYATIGGAVFSFYEALLFSKPSTVSGVIARMGHFTFPFAGMGFVFGSSLCMLGKTRKTNDLSNHVIAGALAGSVWGFKYNTIRAGHYMGFFAAFLAGYFRYFNLNNIPMFQIRPESEKEGHPELNFSIKFYDDPGRPNEA